MPKHHKKNHHHSSQKASNEKQKPLVKPTPPATNQPEEDQQLREKLDWLEALIPSKTINNQVLLGALRTDLKGKNCETCPTFFTDDTFTEMADALLHARQNQKNLLTLYCDRDHYFLAFVEANKNRVVIIEPLGKGVGGPTEKIFSSDSMDDKTLAATLSAGHLNFSGSSYIKPLVDILKEKKFDVTFNPDVMQKDGVSCGRLVREAACYLADNPSATAKEVASAAIKKILAYGPNSSHGYIHCIDDAAALEVYSKSMLFSAITSEMILDVNKSLPPTTFITLYLDLCSQIPKRMLKERVDLHRIFFAKLELLNAGNISILKEEFMVKAREDYIQFYGQEDGNTLFDRDSKQAILKYFSLIETKQLPGTDSAKISASHLQEKIPALDDAQIEPLSVEKTEKLESLTVEDSSTDISLPFVSPYTKRFNDLENERNTELAALAEKRNFVLGEINALEKRFAEPAVSKSSEILVQTHEKSPIQSDKADAHSKQKQDSHNKLKPVASDSSKIVAQTTEKSFADQLDKADVDPAQEERRFINANPDLSQIARTILKLPENERKDACAFHRLLKDANLPSSTYKPLLFAAIKALERKNLLTSSNFDEIKSNKKLREKVIELSNNDMLFNCTFSYSKKPDSLISKLCELKKTLNLKKTTAWSRLDQNPGCVPIIEEIINLYETNKLNEDRLNEILVSGKPLSLISRFMAESDEKKPATLPQDYFEDTPGNAVFLQDLQAMEFLNIIENRKSSMQKQNPKETQKIEVVGEASNIPVSSASQQTRKVEENITATKAKSVPMVKIKIVNLDLEFDKAAQFFMKGDYANAIESFSYYLKFDHQNIKKILEAHRMRGFSYSYLIEKKGDYLDKAITDLEIASTPDDTLLQHNLALCYKYKCDYQKAIEIFERLLLISKSEDKERIIQSLSECYFYWAYAYWQKEDYLGASEILEKPFQKTFPSFNIDYWEKCKVLLEDCYLKCEEIYVAQVKSGNVDEGLANISKLGDRLIRFFPDDALHVLSVYADLRKYFCDNQAVLEKNNKKIDKQMAPFLGPVVTINRGGFYYHDQSNPSSDKSNQIPLPRQKR